MTHSPPKRSTASLIRRSSVATMTRDTHAASAARRYTCSIIGRPAISASALPGSRVDSYLAGMMATAETGTLEWEGPVLDTGGTSNLTTDGNADEHRDQRSAGR